MSSEAREVEQLIVTPPRRRVPGERHQANLGLVARKRADASSGARGACRRLAAVTVHHAAVQLNADGIPFRGIVIFRRGDGELVLDAVGRPVRQPHQPVRLRAIGASRAQTPERFVERDAAGDDVLGAGRSLFRRGRREEAPRTPDQHGRSGRLRPAARWRAPRRRAFSSSLGRMYNIERGL